VIKMKSPAASPDSSRFTKAIEGLSSAKFRDGNKLTLLQNGDEIFPAMLDAIRSAQHSIEFVTFVFWRSNIATRFADALGERAKAGVTVRLLVDAAGGASIGARTVWQLERAGVQVAWFRPGRFRYLHRINHRTHRKILLVDGHIGFTGGVGIADEWAGAAQDKRHWRETHCRIDGPACIDLHAGFAENWREATRQKLEPPTVEAEPGQVAVCTTISSSGRSRPTAMETLFSAVIKTARRKLWITSAYFVPSPVYVEAIIAAARRGVDVRVLTNGHLSNHRVTMLAGRATYGRLLEAGVKIYEYEQTMLHTKIMTADGSYATIGSTNLDDRSLVLNDELNISVTDVSIVSALDMQFLQDLKCSRHIRTTHWYQRGWANRVAEAGSSVFRGQL